MVTLFRIDWTFSRGRVAEHLFGWPLSVDTCRVGECAMFAEEEFFIGMQHAIVLLQFFFFLC